MIAPRAAVAALALAVAACAGEEPPYRSDGAEPAPAAVARASPGPPPERMRQRPSWLGTRVLPRGPHGYGEIRPTPKILRNRRLPTIDLLPPPSSRRFTSLIRAVPDAILRRSTWSPRCPVGRDDLRYVTVAFWGFDDRPHTGELLVHQRAAAPLVRVFEGLYENGFPIEEMRVVAKPELSAPPTGDGNNTTAFVCRPSRGSTQWSQHAYGLAVDVNPFHNPYVSDDVVLPELASAYKNRAWRRPGMIFPTGAVVRAFAAIGWSWGGEWTSLKDWMHFSSTGR